MQNFEYYVTIGGTQIRIPEPDNWQQLQLELSFENDTPEAVFNSTKLIFKGSNAAIMDEWLTAGITGSVGIFEGIPLVIKVCDSTQIVFDGIIDLTTPDTKFTCDIVQVTIRDKRMDMFSQLVDSVGFDYLATLSSSTMGNIKPGALPGMGSGLSTGDYVVIPYQRNDVPDYLQLLSLLLAFYQVYQMMDTVLDIIQEEIILIAQIAGDVIAALDPGDTPLTLVDTAEALAKLILYGLLIAALVIIMVALIKAAFNCLISPVLTKYGMYATTLMQKTCDYFGLKYSSSILNTNSSNPFSRLVIMPTKNAWTTNISFIQTFDIFNSTTKLMEYDDDYNLNNGGYAYGYPDGTCGDFIRSMEDVFNAKAKIIIDASGAPVLHFERWDYWALLASGYQLPAISDQAPFNSNGPFNITGRSESAFSTNASEIISNYIVKYAMDETDLNTYTYYEGSSCSCTTQPNTINVPRNVLLQHLKEVNLQYAQAKRKDNDTAIESLFSQVYNIVMSIASVIMSVSVAPFSRTDHLLLSGDTTSTPKMFIAGPVKNYTHINISNWHGRSAAGVTIDPNNKDIIGARKLMKNFHFSNLALTSTPGSAIYATPYPINTTYFNQYLTYKDQVIPLCCDDYVSIKENNVITLQDGFTKARVDSIKWNPFKSMATIDYRINKQYTNNLNTTFVIDGVITTKFIQNL